MNKKILLIVVSLLSTSCMASMSSTTYIDLDPYKCTANQWCDIYTKHDWSISNDTTTAQTVSICYTTTGCADSPSQKKTMTNCDQVTLNSMETKAGTKTEDLRSYYSLQGGCKIIASTQMNGWITQSSNREARLYINN